MIMDDFYNVIIGALMIKYGRNFKNAWISGNQIFVTITECDGTITKDIKLEITETTC